MPRHNVSEFQCKLNQRVSCWITSLRKREKGIHQTLTSKHCENCDPVPSDGAVKSQNSCRKIQGEQNTRKVEKPRSGVSMHGDHYKYEHKCPMYETPIVSNPGTCVWTQCQWESHLHFEPENHSTCHIWIEDRRITPHVGSVGSAQLCPDNKRVSPEQRSDVLVLLVRMMSTISENLTLRTLHDLWGHDTGQTRHSPRHRFRFESLSPYCNCNQ